MENLEDLDNKTLRAKCLEYGLPNIPITDTSRKLLIKRLRAAIESGVKPVTENKSAPAAVDKDKDKPKTRRETIQVNKPDTPTKEEQRTREKSKSPSRRRTVNVAVPAAPASAPTSGKSSPTPAVPAQITQRRRSGRITPIAQPEPVLTEPIKNKLKSTIVEEELIVIEDDDSRPSSRQSRASSLSVSPTVTTTYTRDVVAHAINEDDGEEDEGDFLYATYEPRYLKRSEYVCGEEKSSSMPITTTNIQKQSSYTSSRASQLGFSRPSFTSTAAAPRISSYNPTTTSIDSSSNINRRYTSVGGVRDITTSYAYDPGRTTSNYQHLMREDSGSDDNEPNGRYLSEFARRLTKLKAEPIDPGTSTIQQKLQHESYPTRRVSVKRNDPKLYQQNQQESTVKESFKQLFFALDHKYGLKNKLCILGVMLLFFVIVYFYK